MTKNKCKNLAEKQNWRGILVTVRYGYDATCFDKDYRSFVLRPRVKRKKFSVLSSHITFSAFNRLNDRLEGRGMFSYNYAV